MDENAVEVTVILNGNGTFSLYLNKSRIAGNKPDGMGTEYTRYVDKNVILEAVGNNQNTDLFDCFICQQHNCTKLNYSGDGIYVCKSCQELNPLCEGCHGVPCAPCR